MNAKFCQIFSKGGQRRKTIGNAVAIGHSDLLPIKIFCTWNMCLLKLTFRPAIDNQKMSGILMEFVS